MRRTAGVILVALAMAACGGDGGDEVAETCDALHAAEESQDLLPDVLRDAAVGEVPLEEAKERFGEAADLMVEAAEGAPDEIADDLEELAAPIVRFDRVLQDAETPEDVAAALADAGDTDTQENTAAADRVGVWNDEHCAPGEAPR